MMLPFPNPSPWLCPRAIISPPEVLGLGLVSRPAPTPPLLHLSMWLNNQSACLADLLVHGQTTWLQNTPRLSATVVHLGFRQCCVRRDRSASSLVVVNLSGQTSKLARFAPKPSNDAVRSVKGSYGQRLQPRH